MDDPTPENPAPQPTTPAASPAELEPDASPDAKGLLKALLTERGQHQEAKRRLSELAPLADEAKILREKVKAFEEAEQARTEARAAKQRERVEALSDDLRALVPDGLTGDALDAHLDRVELLKPKEPKPEGAPEPAKGRTHPGGGDPDALTEEQREWAKEQGYEGASAKTIQRAWQKLVASRSAA